MSRLRRLEQRGRYFFVTTNLASGTPALTPKERTLVLEQLDRAREKGGFFLFGYVIMPAHVHLLLWPQHSDLTAVLRDFKSKTALELGAQRRSRMPLWQPRYFDFICRRVADFHAKLAYIHNNPVEAGLVTCPEDWTWSSAALSPPIRVDGANLPVDRNALIWPAPWR
jgi:REP element-mobilizing transposase RayT